MTHSNAQKLIRQSVTTGDVAWQEYDYSTHLDLMDACDGWVDHERTDYDHVVRTWEFWGYNKGGLEWRVHLTMTA